MKYFIGEFIKHGNLNISVYHTKILMEIKKLNCQMRGMLHGSWFFVDNFPNLKRATDFCAEFH